MGALQQHEKSASPLAEWMQRRAKREADLKKVVKVGSRLFVSAQFTNVGHIVVDEVSATGVRCGGWWFGWHEIVSVNES